MTPARLWRRLRCWWTSSPRARQLPQALAVPLLIAAAGSLCAIPATGLARWAFLLDAAAGVGLAVALAVVVLTGRSEQ